MCRGIKVMRKSFLILLVFILMLCFSACEKGDKEIWDLIEYKELEDIISIEEIKIGDAFEGASTVKTYNVRYKSDDCEVVSYISIPNKCLENKEQYPCIIYNRGGNRNYGANRPIDIAAMAASFDKIVFASQYRGNAGGTGKEEFGGADLQDVIKLIDLCEEFSFVDMNNLYMVGVSRGGMMTYMAAREDERIKKAAIISGISDLFMWYEERIDMRNGLSKEFIGGTPEELSEEYEKRSATYWADELKCPVLIIHSKLDERVSYKQAEKMVECLKEAGIEHKFITYEDDVHGLHQEDFEIIMEWCQ